MAKVLWRCLECGGEEQHVAGCRFEEHCDDCCLRARRVAVDATAELVDRVQTEFPADGAILGNLYEAAEHLRKALSAIDALPRHHGHAGHELIDGGPCTGPDHFEKAALEAARAMVARLDCPAIGSTAASEAA